MIQAYVNYPNKRARIHHDPSCGHVTKRDSPQDRTRQLTPTSLSAELRLLEDLPFRAEAGANAVWLDIDCDDAEFERAVAEFVLRRLAGRYRPFAEVSFEVCCEG